MNRRNNIPIHVIRLDGFWSLKNPFLPTSVLNSVAYRAFLSVLHMNNVRTTLCCVIDLHLKPENKDLSEEEKIKRICAELYAYGRHTKDLTPKQIETIKTEISSNMHLSIWNNKVAQDAKRKELLKLKEEEAKLEEPTLLSMSR